MKLMEEVYGRHKLVPNPSPDTLGPILQKKESLSIGAVFDTVKAEDGLRVMLILRAALFGASCATAADVSEVVETKVGRRIVQFL